MGPRRRRPLRGDCAPPSSRRSAGSLRARDGPERVRIGIGLHRGELAYGNIGTPDRLDFTVIGTTVNTASRIEGMTGKLGVPVLGSREVASCAPGAWSRAGAFELKGHAGATELFVPTDPSAHG